MSLPRKKLALIISALTALTLGIVVLLTVIRVGQEKPVAPTVPEAEPEASEIKLIVPDDYSSCSTQSRTDTVRTENVGSRKLKGFVEVQFILGDGNRQAYKRYDVDQTGDLNLEITYPPVYEWPSHATGIKEMHVDISIEVYDGDIKILTLGPGQDWDVYCTANIPSAPPSAVPSPTASLIPTPRPTPRPTVTPRPTPTVVPSPTATPAPTPTPGTGGPNPSPSPTPVPSPTATPVPTSSPNPTATPGTGGPNPSPSPSPTSSPGTGGPNPSPSSSPVGIAQVNPTPTTTPSVPVAGTSTPTIILISGALVLLMIAFFAF